MFCDKCGNQLPDGARFCGRCGNSVSAQVAAPQQPVQEPVYEAPVYEQPVQEPVYEAPVYEQPVQEPVYEAPVYEQPVQEPVYEAPVYQQPVQEPVYEAPVYQQPVQQQAYAQTTYAQPAAMMTKKQFYKANGGPRALSWVSRILLFVCVALIGVCCYMTLTMSVLDIPIVSILASDAADELEKTMDEGDELLDKLPEDLDILKEEANLTDEEVELIEDAVEKMDNLIKKPSIWTCVTVVKEVYENDDVMDIVEDLDYDKLDNTLDDTKGLMDVLNPLLYGIIGVFAFCALLALLAACFNNTPLAVCALVVSSFVCSLMSSIPMGLALIAAFIAAIVCNSISKGAYKKYLRTVRTY